MSLSGNTEKINELLSKINALPEAGSGSVAEPKFRTGYITITGASPASTQTKVASVTGLDFSPVCVYIQRNLYTDITSSSQNQFLTLFSAPGGGTLGTRGLVFRGTARVYTGDEMMAYVIATDDGFELYNGDFSNMYYNSTYDYIAVGY